MSEENSGAEVSQPKAEPKNADLGGGVYSGPEAQFAGKRLRAKECSTPDRVFIQFEDPELPMSKGWWMFDVAHVTLDSAA